MAYKSIIAGAALIVVGVFGNIVSDTGSITTLIPAFIGVIFVALGVAGRAKPDLNHHLMHAAAALALLALISSAGSAIGRSSTGLALFTQLATVIVMACLPGAGNSVLPGSPNRARSRGRFGLNKAVAHGAFESLNADWPTSSRRSPGAPLCTSPASPDRTARPPI